MSAEQKRKKLKRYKAALKKALKYKDGRGKGMDAHIIKTVALLNVMGFKTSMSCEGHLTPDYADIVPWVHIHIGYDKKKELRARNLVRSYWKYREPAHIARDTAIWMNDIGLDKKRRTLHTLRIQVGTEHFYRVVPYKARIPRPVLKWFLTNGRKEMRAFTRYLWKRYFGELKAR